MARLTLAEAEERYFLFRLLAILISGENPDGTTFTLPTEAPAPEAADVLAGRQAVTATTAATTIITVPAGRTWVGEVGASVACTVAAASAVAGQASAAISVAGAGATPAAGTYFGVVALAAANAGTGTTGSNAANSGKAPLTVVAPAGNPVTVQVTSTIAGTSGSVDAYASGKLV